MGLRLKFNLVMLLLFSVGMAVSAWVSHRLLDDNAKQETLRSAGLMMEAGAADRVSTDDFDVAEFPASRDEIGVLAESFNRMRRSLCKAIELIDA